MQVIMTMEEYLEFQQAKENLKMCVDAAQYCEKQQRYQQQNDKNYLIKSLANQNWNDIDCAFNKSQD